jgi:3-dehydro-L-gulonate 2-dehydrogenase
MNRIPFEEVQQTLAAVLRNLGFSADRAATGARLFAETTRDGVYTHGINRFPRYVAQIRAGNVIVDAEPKCAHAFGAIERWDGQLGPGNLNALAMMDRAMTLSREHGIGCVALANTNHWMRAGTYGWQAAEAGFVGICWTNTMPNLPPWGGVERVIGNNPLVIGVPRPAGAVVLDMAMSQFSYGTLAAYAKRGQPLPAAGGFDGDGNVTTDAAAIEASQRALPIGYWKGSGLSLMLDLFAAALSGGLATHQLPLDPLQESGISQFFLAIDPSLVADPSDPEAQDRLIDGILASVHAAAPVEAGKPARYPGEQTLHLRAENLRLGVPVDSDVWENLLKTLR